jgi:hypothetical protein
VGFGCGDLFHPPACDPFRRQLVIDLDDVTASYLAFAVDVNGPAFADSDSGHDVVTLTMPAP